MRSFILLPAYAVAASNEESTSLMQKRLLKQMGNLKAENTPDNYAPEPPAYGEPDHVCGKWSAWSDCDATCGGGWQSRTYSFLDGVKCGVSCPHGDGDKETRECNVDVNCPVDCVGSWGELDTCSRTCGGGKQSRMYTVTQPAMHGGKACPRACGAVEDHDCSTEPCEEDCEGHWGEWSDCSNGGYDNCGPGGTRSRSYIVSHEHTYGGCDCPLRGKVQTESCELPCCAENCEGEWSKYGTCEGYSVKPWPKKADGYEEVPECCGGGMKSRTFSVKKESVCGGQCCEAQDGAVETATCCEAPCPIDCVGHWEGPGDCCSDCGGGQQESVFVIDVPAQHGGDECPNKCGDIKREPCNTHECPIHCEGEWSEWDKCTVDCVEAYGDGGTQSRHWIVTQEAEYGGKKCSETDQVEIRKCTDPAPERCPIPAVCKWTEYGDCDACCFDTLNPTPIMKYRKWIEVTPAEYGGAECINSPPYGESEEAECKKPNCPIDCVGEWSEFTTCDADQHTCDYDTYFCGGGTQTRVYNVVTQAQFGGKECPHCDGTKDSKDCGDTPCPTDCVGHWTEWSECCSSCGGGSQSRQYIIDVESQHCGKKCPHLEQIEHRPCNEECCPEDCEGSWSCWGDCDQECQDCRGYGSPGKSQRTYTIHHEAVCGGKQCPHKQGEVAEQTCNEHCCAEDCEGHWTEFGECSTTCGNGVTERTYHITHHAAHGGKECPHCDKASHTKECDYTSPCPVDCDGEWSEYSCCSEKCGGGEQTRWFMQHTQAQHGGQECKHGQFEQDTKKCNEHECPQMCLGAFSAFGACDAPCSGGTKSRTFNVFRPAAGGGPECEHADGHVDTAPCNTHDCPLGYVCPPDRTCKMANGLIQVR